ncbi:MAG: CehA/McbA family metallohydrolase [Bacteroidota bacterium]|nr:CehA/McbA family metallohydrolase [Bacteroidota bacterium]
MTAGRALCFTVAVVAWPAAASAQPVIYPIVPKTYVNAQTGGNYMFNYYLPPPGSGYPWWPAWHPDGRHLAFSMHGTLWSLDLESNQAHELVRRPEYLSSPAWHPDGQRLVFTADNGEAINLYLLDLSDGTVRTITEGRHLNLDPVWSPDGSQLAYVTTFPNGYFNIHVRADGTELPVTADHSFGRSRLYFGEYDLHIQPAWLPDGDSLLVLSNRSIALGSGGLWTVPIEPDGMRRARQVHREETLYRTRADISPDGTRFVYSSHLGGQYSNLFVLPVAGGEPYKLTFGTWDSFHPRFSPDGHQVAYLSNQEGLPELRMLQVFGGRDEAIQIDSLHWQMAMGRVEVTVVDDATGRVLPARIYSKASDGKTYTPADAYQRQGRMSEHFFHTDGTYAQQVPVGAYTVEAMHGFEYHPAAVTVDIRPQATTEVSIRLRRMADLKAQGWYSGSNHVHMNYAGNLHNTPENLVFMARAEDLDVIGQLVANKDNRILDYQHFTGAPHALTDSAIVLYFNEEYRPPFYGHVSFINLTEHLISPFVTGYEGTAIESLYPSNTQMFRLARQQGALGAYVHPYWGSEDPLETNLGVAKAFPVDVALGTVDYHELVSGAGWAAYHVWHQVLNNGFNLPAVGGEDAISSLHRTAIIGQMRAYAYMPDGLSWEGWLHAIRTGAMFVTNGPLLEFTINGKSMGDTLRLDPNDSVVSVRGRVQSIVPLDRIELVEGGRIISVDVAPSNTRATDYMFTVEVDIAHSTWLTFQVASDSAWHPIDDRFVQATTNPVWILRGNEPVRSSRAAGYFIQWIDKLSAMAEVHPGWRSEAERTSVLDEFAEARRVYEERLEEAQALGR